MSDFVMNEDQAPLERRAEELRQDLLYRDLKQLAELTGTSLAGDPANPDFEFLYWERPVRLPAKDFVALDRESGQPLPPIHQAMILYYFHDSKGSPGRGQWISFSQLADGQFYNAAFQGYTAGRLQAFFGMDYSLFQEKNQELCGQKLEFGDLAYRYQILPRVAMLIVCWKGDDEFPPSYKILFEDIADYHLPTDACAILASMLTGKLTGA